MWLSANAKQRIEELARQLRETRYVPQPVRRAMTRSSARPRNAPLGIPAVRDRVVQAALRRVLQPIFEREFARDVLVSGPAVVRIRRWSGWKPCSARATPTWWMPT